MSMFSPRFKSVAAMAGWDEETLLSTLVVEDTPDRILKDKNRSDLLVISPTSSRRKRRRARPGSIPIAVFNLDDDDESSITTNIKEAEKSICDLSKNVEVISKDKEQENTATADCSSSSTLPCLDRLRDELSCSICLDICYEPSTTPCGHSFCMNCLKSAADKCGRKCPKCRQLISNGRSCTINTVLWNTIQLLFPAEVESRNAAAEAAVSSKVATQRKKSTERASSTSNQANDNSNQHMNTRLRVTRRSVEASLSSRRGVPNQDENAALALRLQREADLRCRRGVPNQNEDAALALRLHREANLRGRRGVSNQDDDAALALRLQREEFMENYRGSTLARDNLRAMARRVINLTRSRNG